MWLYSTLLTLVASPSPSAPPGFLEQIAPKDWISFCVGLVGAVVAVLHAWIDWRGNRHQPAIDTFLELTEKVKARSDELIGRVLSNLTGAFDGEPPDENVKKNKMLYEALASEVDALSKHLRPKEAQRMKDALKAFWDSLPEIGYPLIKTEDGVRPNSYAWQTANKASKKWTTHLTDLRQRCAQHKLRCW